MFSKIGQPKVYLEILNQIKALIGSGALSAGGRLPSERVMAEEMSVSRATIREAIRSLELIGVVRCVQGEGNFLTDSLDRCMLEPLSMMFMLGSKDIRQLQQLRHGLEVQAASLAARMATPEQTAELESLCVQIESAQDPQTRALTDQKFHHTVASLSGNTLITGILNAAEALIDNLISDLRSRIINDRDSSESIDRQHMKIASAIKAQDSEAAARAMDGHMQLINKLIDEYM